MTVVSLQPGRWWRVQDAWGAVLLETSNEREARNLARRTSGATLHRCHELLLQEWRPVVPK